MIGMRKLTEVREAHDNPRVITDANLEKLINSLLVFPKMMRIRPLVADEQGGLIGGNMRHRALTLIARMDDAEMRQRIDQECEVSGGDPKMLVAWWAQWKAEGMPVPVAGAEDWTGEEQEQFVIKDNVSYGYWDMDKLAEIDERKLGNWGAINMRIDLPKGGEPEDGSGAEQTEKRKRERVIIIYSREQAERVAEMIGVDTLRRNAYKVEELD